MGATPFGYQLAAQFGIEVVATRAALVPLTLQPEDKTVLEKLAGVAVDCDVSNQRQGFRGNVLFTHRGLSGPAVLQLSSYWREGEQISVNLDPGATLFNSLRTQRQEKGSHALKTELSRHLPAKLADFLAAEFNLSGNLADQSDAALKQLAGALSNWHLTPSGTEGYRTAEVTLGGIDTAELSSQTMEAKSVPGLYIIGEAVDVTGWLGGFNFQWAWSSAHAAGTAIKPL